MSVNLRAMTGDDLESVVNIQNRITRSPASDMWREKLAEHVGNPHLPAYVADMDGEVIGFIYGEIKVGVFGADLSGWIEMVGVQPEHMGQGLGGKLAQRVLRHFREQGVEDILTSVRWDSGDMLAFFKSLGFDRSPFINLQLKVDPGQG
jgi:ribosomal protein S18 acetylase RimI-like enzyme